MGCQYDSCTHFSSSYKEICPNEVLFFFLLGPCRFCFVSRQINVIYSTYYIHFVKFPFDHQLTVYSFIYVKKFWISLHSSPSIKVCTTLYYSPYVSFSLLFLCLSSTLLFIYFFAGVGWSWHWWFRRAILMVFIGIENQD